MDVTPGAKGGRRRFVYAGVTAVGLVAVFGIVIASSGLSSSPTNGTSTTYETSTFTTSSLFSYTSPEGPTSTNSSTSNSQSISTSGSGSAPFQVLATNVSVTYNTECLVLENTGHTCPTISAGATGASPSGMRNVELISYQGTQYYAGNFSAGFTGPPVSHNIWFTNSSIFCTSPSFPNYDACPVDEALPLVSW